MKNEYYSNSNDYINRWVISYADFVTMLLALFMVMFATTSMGDTKVKDVNKSIQKVFSAQSVQQKENNENVKNIEEKQDTQSQLDNTGKTLLEGGDGILDSGQLIEEFKKDIELNSSIKVLKEPRGVVIRLNDTMLFDQGSAIIKPEAMATLDRIAASLDKFKNPIVIEGHTDSMPIRNKKYPSNWELSTSRATNIIKYLTQVINKDERLPEFSDIGNLFVTGLKAIIGSILLSIPMILITVIISILSDGFSSATTLIIYLLEIIYGLISLIMIGNFAIDQKILSMVGFIRAALLVKDNSSLVPFILYLIILNILYGVILTVCAVTIIGIILVPFGALAMFLSLYNLVGQFIQNAPHLEEAKSL